MVSARSLLSMSLRHLSIIAITTVLGLVPGLADEVAFDAKLGEMRALREKAVAVLGDAGRARGAAGRIDVQVADWFADYLAWEEAHPELTKAALVGDQVFSDDELVGKEEAERRYREHLERERDGALALLGRASGRLEAKRRWPAVPETDWRRMRLPTATSASANGRCFRRVST